MISRLVDTCARLLAGRLPARVEIHERRRQWPGQEGRFGYQNRYTHFKISSDERVLDLGCGGYPFAYATVLVERFLETSRHRHETLATDGKPLVVADIHRLPFADRSFDFVYCSHVLEHVESPRDACAEIMRVGKRGFVETPTMAKDALFAWAKDMHKWHVVAIGQSLCFFEYSQRQLNGIGSSAWKDLILSRWYHPLQEAFYDNQDLFNVMFTWSERFSVFVFRLDGTVEALDAEVDCRNALSDNQHRLP